MFRITALETPAERDADSAGGRYLTGGALEEWLEALVGDGELPSLDDLRQWQPER
jgi:hypothetical protein